MFDQEDDDVGYEFSDYNLFDIFEKLKNSSPILMEHPTEEIVSKFREKFSPDERNMYFMTETEITNFMNDVVDSIINDTLMEMVKAGIVDMSFDSDQNDFVFFLKDSKND